ncbi:hypothetical protein K490DRAFT_63418 [Saccharata proteae CBS 121410]|uniref:Gfd2/YDR514C-like C-terminal domain-containing protein n=1 Tax=Saccharata proteae CBS 121410 TaxID=1314787 RepID=A0A6A5YBN3_9PEZI|nr:hypothetical protein K490DRAFT_63418 [Saccharata proteae CBS 121410]
MFVTTTREEGMEVLATALGLTNLSSIEGVKRLDALYAEIDTESAVNKSGTVTEIGIAVLDLRTISTDPGPHASKWMAQVKTYHIRIVEHADCVSRISDRRGNFLWNAHGFQYGRSEWVTRKMVNDRLADILRVRDDSQPGKFRDVLLAAHAWKNEEDALKQLGFPLRSLGNVRGIVDTQTLAVKPGRTRSGLHGLLGEAQVDTTGMHNAGNDAVLQKLVTLREVLAEYKPEVLINHPWISAESVLADLKDKLYRPADRTRCNTCGKYGHNEGICRRICSGCRQFGHTRIRCQASPPWIDDDYPGDYYPGWMREQWRTRHAAGWVSDYPPDDDCVIIRLGNQFFHTYPPAESEDTQEFPDLAPASGIRRRPRVSTAKRVEPGYDSDYDILDDI